METSLPDFPLTTDPIWPWSIPGLGWVLLLAVAALLTAMTVATYWSLPGMRRGRVAAILSLRLAALALVYCVLAGLSVVYVDAQKVPSLLLVGIDSSQSMSAVQDEVDGQTRWGYLQRNLRDAEPVLESLRRDHNVTVLFFRFGDNVGEYDPANPGEANGQRTDTAQVLQTLLDRYRGERYLRGLYVLSDGADNGVGEPGPGQLASQYRGARIPISTFAYGKTTTTDKQGDVAITSLKVPDLVPVKGKLRVEGMVDAMGFQNNHVRVRLYLNDQPVEGEGVTLKLNGEDVTQKPQVLRLLKDNRIEFECNAPAVPGDYKVTLRVLDPVRDTALTGEVSALNNEKSSYLTVSSEGVSVLLVDREGHFPEPQMIVDALNEDSRIRVTTLWLRGKNLSAAQKNLFEFGRQKYDVIIIGDALAGQFLQADPRSLDTIREMVEKQNAGVLMLGGRYSFGNADWKGTPLESMMPVRFDRQGQKAGSVRMQPSPSGLRHFITRLTDGNDDAQRALWRKLPPLEGRTLMGDPLGDATVLAEAEDGAPLLVTRAHGSGRTMALATETTHLWVMDEETRKLHARFWQQAILWLAKRDQAGGNLRLRLEKRLVPVGTELPFSAQLRGKKGEEVKVDRYDLKLIDPKGTSTPVPVSKVREADGGAFKAALPGEYRLVGRATGKDAAGDTVEGSAEVRFMSEQNDAETLRRAADHDFLQSLADSGGGKRYRPAEFVEVLKRLPNEPLPQAPPRAVKWPDWRTARGRSPFLTGFLLLFVQLLALEWFLRRQWGMI